MNDFSIMRALLYKITSVFNQNLAKAGLRRQTDVYKSVCYDELCSRRIVLFNIALSSNRQGRKLHITYNNYYMNKVNLKT